MQLKVKTQTGVNKHLFRLPAEVYDYIQKKRLNRKMIHASYFCRPEFFVKKTLDYYSNKTLKCLNPKHIMFIMDDEVVNHLKRCQQKYSKPLWVCFCSSIGFIPKEAQYVRSKSR